MKTAREKRYDGIADMELTLIAFSIAPNPISMRVHMKIWIFLLNVKIKKKRKSNTTDSACPQLICLIWNFHLCFVFFYFSFLVYHVIRRIESVIAKEKTLTLSVKYRPHVPACPLREPIHCIYSVRFYHFICWLYNSSLSIFFKYNARPRYVVVDTLFSWVRNRVHI